MAEPQNDRPTQAQYEETTDPKNPPNSVLNPQVRRAALRSYLGPLVVFVVVVGLALLYWANRGPVTPDPGNQSQIGTTGNPDDRLDVVGERGNREETPGGRSVDPRHGSTADELKYRGDDRGKPLPGLQRESTITGLSMLEGEPKELVGRRVEISNVAVVDVQDPSRFWIHDGNVKAEVTARRGGPAVKNGSRITVSGAVEADGRDGVRIRADKVELN